MNKILISIAIPTKNRYYCLKGAIESFLMFDRDDYEVIIQDNSDDNSEILDYFKHNNIPSHIKYYYERESMSVGDNSDLAISHANGKYIISLGDDDTITDNLFKVAEYMDMKNIDSCLGGIIRYNWAELIKVKTELHSLNIKKIKGYIKQEYPTEILNKVLESGGTSMYNLPRVYHGIISKKIMDEVKQKTGSYFPGPSPDMASSVAMSLYIKSHLETDYPIIISGYSYNSAGGMGARRAHVGDLASLPHLPKNILEIWCADIPKIWTAQTIWAESLIESLNRCNSIKAKEINYTSFYAEFLLYHHSYFSYIPKKSPKFHLIPVLAKLSLLFVSRSAAYLGRKVGLVDGKTEVERIDNITSLSDAVSYIRNKDDLMFKQP